MKSHTLVLVAVAAIMVSAFFATDFDNKVLGEEQQQQSKSAQTSDDNVAAPPSVDEAALKRTRKTTQTFDKIYKEVIVLITDKYVHDDADFPAGSAAVLLFKTISDSGSHRVRLIDATGEPYNADNVAKDEFEKAAIKQLKAGDEQVEKVVANDGKHYLRTLTPVPVVMEKCVMCHSHYADAAEGEPIGAISYMVPIE
jgi:hypothetical protein